MQISYEELSRMSPEEFARLEFEDARELTLLKTAACMHGERLRASASVARQNYKMLVEKRGIDFAKKVRHERRRLEFENAMNLPPSEGTPMNEAARRILVVPYSATDVWKLIDQYLPETEAD